MQDLVTIKTTIRKITLSVNLLSPPNTNPPPVSDDLKTIAQVKKQIFCIIVPSSKLVNLKKKKF